MLLLANVSLSYAAPSGPLVLDIKRGGANLAVQSDSKLDPAPIGKSAANVFLASLIFSFDRFPDSQVRQTIVNKISEGLPLSGWSIGLTKNSTSIRPAVYWKDLYDNGGWYVFDRFDFRPKVWYAITCVAKPGEYLNLYVEELEPRVADAKLIFESEHGAVFSGGFQIKDIVAPFSDQELSIGAMRQTKRSFRGEVAEFLVAQTKALAEMTSAEEIRKFVSGGPAAIVKKLYADEVNMWLTQGREESRFRRTMKLRGQASWQQFVPTVPESPASSS